MKRQATANRRFTLRRLGPADAASFRELRLDGLEANPEAFASSLDKEASKPLPWFADRLESGIVFGGFTNRATLDGVAGLYVPDAANLSHKGVLWGMYVRPEARGNGLAKDLVARVIEEAEDIVEEILLTVVASNIAAVRLYKGLGFAEYGFERRAIKVGGAYYDELLMALPLETSR